MAKIINGIAASEGIGIAPAYVLQVPDLSYQRTLSTNRRRDVFKFHGALAQSIHQLQLIQQRSRSNSGGDAGVAVLNAHITMLRDPDLTARVENVIQRDGQNAPTAVDTVIDGYVRTLKQAVDNPYMLARVADFEDVRQRIIANLLGKQLPDIASINKPVVVVAHNLTPSDTSQMSNKYIKGIISDLGGTTSHVAIMSRTLQIPAIVGTQSVTNTVKNGEQLIVDGINGHALIDPSESEVTVYTQRGVSFALARQDNAKLVHAKSVTASGEEVKIKANVGTPADVKGANNSGAEGIGLVRTEFLYMDSDHLPSEEEQLSAYKQIVMGMHGKPVTFRTLDIGGDKPLSYLPFPKELNPAMGGRAIRLCFSRPEIFNTQLRALIRASQFGPINIMFPMIATVDELRKAKNAFYAQRKELAKETPGIGQHIKLGMMMEVPAAALTASILAKECDFFSIGTNDLIQYCFAADRANERLAYLYQPLSPAILRLVQSIIKAGHDHGTTVAMCGEMAGDRLAIPLLVGMGLDQYSMNSGAVLSTRAELKRLKVSDCQQLVSAVLSNCEDDQQVKDYVKKWLQDRNILSF